MRIIFSSPNWVISGVNSLNLSLMRRFQAAGHAVELLLIPQVVEQERELALPTDVPVSILEFDPAEGYWRSRWAALTRHLEAAAPCVYFPGYDFQNASVVPCLRDDVVVVGVVHSDDPLHYEHLTRLGRYWNVAIAVSAHLERRVREIGPAFGDRLHQITNGVPNPAALPERAGDRDALNVVFCGRFTQEQKQILDLARIAAALDRRGVPSRWTLIGDGPDAEALRASFGGRAAELTGPLPQDRILALYPAQDCFVLTSAYEGLPIALLEAMAHGVIPVATAIPSGAPEIVRDGLNGYLVPVNDIEAFADRLQRIWRDSDHRERLRQAAFDTVATGDLSIDRVADRYMEVMKRAMADALSGAFRRPKPFRTGPWIGDIMPPPELQVSHDAYFDLMGMYGYRGEKIASLETELAATQQALAEEKVSGLKGSVRKFWRLLRRSVGIGPAAE